MDTNIPDVDPGAEVDPIVNPDPVLVVPVVEPPLSVEPPNNEVVPAVDATEDSKVDPSPTPAAGVVAVVEPKKGSLDFLFLSNTALHLHVSHPSHLLVTIDDIASILDEVDSLGIDSAPSFTPSYSVTGATNTAQQHSNHVQLLLKMLDGLLPPWFQSAKVFY